MHRNASLLKCLTVSLLILVCPGTSDAWYAASNSGAVLGHDLATTVAVVTDGVIAAGYDYAPGNPQWRIEKRNKTTGALVAGFGTGGVITVNYSAGADGGFFEDP